jgi:uncharacterized membrane protein
MLAVLGGAVWSLATSTNITLSSLASFALLAGLTLFISGVVIAGSRG